MTLFKPRVGKVIFAQTTGGLSVIIPLFFFFFFFSQEVRVGSNFQVGQTGSADVIDDVIQLRCGSGYSAWKRVPRGKEAPARDN